MPKRGSFEGGRSIEGEKEDPKLTELRELQRRVFEKLRRLEDNPRGASRGVDRGGLSFDISGERSAEPTGPSIAEVQMDLRRLRSLMVEQEKKGPLPVGFRSLQEVDGWEVRVQQLGDYGDRGVPDR